MYNLENIWNDWKVIRFIGEGSSGKVYEIVRNNMNIEEHSALKVISIPSSKAEIRLLQNEGMSDSEIEEYYHSIVESYVHEISIMSKLKGNPNIVSYEDYKVVKHNNSIGWDIVIRMELLKPFSEILREKALTENDVIDFGIEMCNALSICHSNNILHRDIKYDNIFISNAGIYKLGDFGVAKNIEKTSGNFSIKGTYTYMAPEIYKGQIYDKSTDIYSLGIVLFKLLNHNREPFLPIPPKPITAKDKENALTRRMTGEKLNFPAKATEKMQKIILKACSYNVSDRYSSIEEMKADLLDIKNSTTQNTPKLSNDETDSLLEDKTVSVYNTTFNIEAENISISNKSLILKTLIISAIIILTITLSVILLVIWKDNNKESGNCSIALPSETISTVLNATENSTILETKDPREDIYEEGLSLLERYINNPKKETMILAASKFQEIGEYKKALDYSEIATACLESDIDSAVQTLKKHSEDAYVQQILLLDKYIYSFFKDSIWYGDSEKGTSSSLYLTFDVDESTDYNLPAFGHENDGYYQFVDGTYIVYLDDGSEIEFWDFKIHSEKNIEIFCRETKELIYMKRL